MTGDILNALQAASVRREVRALGERLATLHSNGHGNSTRYAATVTEIETRKAALGAWETWGRNGKPPFVGGINAKATGDKQ